ncbi:hypothetical protein TSAR_008912 [Trichomalopsis sarcophagae]|uniref:Thioredoxin domain-containing protein n=1 Tax=Trichomalopsis sarcophagae TaxID=543379 RepID=A0A232F2T2_9HYME|nr:hypothetical protein TSAR_008912 [Trichomalopsis sarcophagae]
MIRAPTIVVLICVALVQADFNQDTDWSSAQSFYDFKARDLQGNEISLDKYRGHVVVAINGATKCPASSKGFKQLQALLDRYGESDGLRVVNFTVDGLAGGSGTSEEIAAFFQSKNLALDVLEKIETEGDNAHPLYKWMKSQLSTQDKIMPGSKIVIDKNGKVVYRGMPTGPVAQLEDTLKRYF